jgi:hypothetical protein
MGPCIVRKFQYVSNKMQSYTVYYIWNLLCMFRVVPPPIIRNAYKCIYSIWYLVTPLLLSAGIAVGSRKDFAFPINYEI